MRKELFIILFFFISVSNSFCAVPLPYFSVMPENGSIGTSFSLDAYNLIDAASLLPLGLMFRWDWESDGIWDTEFSEKRTASHTFSTTGDSYVTVEVKYSDNNFEAAIKKVVVTPYQLEHKRTLPANRGGDIIVDITFDGDLQTPILYYAITANEPLTSIAMNRVAGTNKWQINIPTDEDVDTSKFDYYIIYKEGEYDLSTNDFITPTLNSVGYAFLALSLFLAFKKKRIRDF